MKKIFLSLIFLMTCAYAQTGVISGKINHDDINYKNKIVDYKKGVAIDGAKITIPDLNYTTYSASEGTFKLNIDINHKTVLFVEKDGYKTFSLTIDNSVLKSPLKLGIEESSPFDLQVTQGVIHLGDNLFSENSANSAEFHDFANGSYMRRNFQNPNPSKDEDVIIKIGSLIGLDTKKAKEKGQNRIASVYASPAEVYINGRRIASLELNGDNIEVVVPKNILKAQNELMIKTGVNLFQTKYTDYDDIELANIRIELKQTHSFAKH